MSASGGGVEAIKFASSLAKPFSWLVIGTPDEKTELAALKHLIYNELVNAGYESGRSTNKIVDDFLECLCNEHVYWGLREAAITGDTSQATRIVGQLSEQNFELPQVPFEIGAFLSHLIGNLHKILQEETARSRLSEAFARARYEDVIEQVHRLQGLVQELLSQPQVQADSRTTVQEAQNRFTELPTVEIPSIAPPPAGSVRGPKYYKYFVGRKDTLREIAQLVKDEGSQKDCAVVRTISVGGIGGSGKTQVAGEFTNLYGQFFLGGVYWVNFTDSSTVPQTIASLGEPGRLELWGNSADLSLEQKVRLVRQAWEKETPRLLVFDNCEDEELLGEWLPDVGGCRVLITARGSSWPPSLGNIVSIRLDEFTRPESIDLLRKHLQNDSEDIHSLLDALSDELGDLPLAIDMAARHLREFRFDVTLEQYLSEIREERTLHTSLNQEHEHSSTGHELSVFLTFKRSFDRLSPSDSVDQCARNLLLRVKYLAANQPVPRQLIWALLAVDESDTERKRLVGRALTRLENLGLVKQDEESGDIIVHQLVADAIGRETEAETSLTEVESASINLASHTFEYGTPAAGMKLVSHLGHLVDQAADREDTHVHDLLRVLGGFEQRLGQYVKARDHYERALDLARRIFSVDDLRIAQDLENIGVLTKREGDVDTAIDVYEQLLETYEQNARYQQILSNPIIGSEEEVRTFSSVHLNLGSAQRDQAVRTGNYELLRTVKKHYDTALHIRTEALGDHIDTVESLINMALLGMDFNDEAMAWSFAERTLQMNERRGDEGDVKNAEALSIKGELFLRDEKYEQARDEHERALRIRESSLPPDHDDILESLENIATVLWFGGKAPEARPYLERAAVIRDAKYGDSIETAQVLDRLASVLVAEGNYDEARSNYERALTITENITGSSSFEVATTQNNLAFLLYTHALEKRQNGTEYCPLLEEARYYGEQALATFEGELEDNEPILANSLQLLSSILLILELYPEARSRLERSLTVGEAAYGSDSDFAAYSRTLLQMLDADGL